MPRAPQSSALLAGSPLAKRSVLSISRSRTRSMPLSSDMSTRLTRGTGARRRPSGCQAKASAAAKSGDAGTGGASRSSAAAIRSAVSGEPLVGAVRRFDPDRLGDFPTRFAMPSALFAPHP